MRERIKTHAYRHYNGATVEAMYDSILKTGARNFENMKGRSKYCNKTRDKRMEEVPKVGNSVALD